MLLSMRGAQMSVGVFKKRIIFTVIACVLMTLICAACAFLVGCENDAPPAHAVSFTVKYKAEDGGYIDGDSEQEVERGKNGATVTAIAENGYMFVEWSDGVTTAERQETEVQSDISVTAKFEIIKISLSYSAEQGGYIDGECEQEIEYGKNGKPVAAVAQNGYRFVEWSDGVQTAERQDTNIMVAKDIKAKFEFLFDGGEGSIESPFLINSYIHLRNMTHYPRDNYKLLRDLDLTGECHAPIFEGENEFCGAFDGGGFTVKNVCIDAESADISFFGRIGKLGRIANIKLTAINVFADGQGDCQNIGMISSVCLGELQNIAIKGRIIVYPIKSMNLGGLVGLALGKITNCSVEVEIVRTSYNNIICNIGGLVGKAEDLSLSTCNVLGTINAVGCKSGGAIAVYRAERSDGIITDIDIDVIIENSSVGAGFINEVFVADCASLEVKNCSVSSEKINSAQAVGFIYTIYGNSDNTKSVIKNCCCNANVIANLASGFIYSGYDISVSNSFFNGEISTIDSYGNIGLHGAGFIYSAHDMIFECCYASVEIESNHAAAFVYNSIDCVLEQCFSSGDIYVNKHGAGLVYIQRRGRISNCYSTCNVTDYNNDATKGGTQIAGFIKFIADSYICNSYYAGKITGNVLAHEGVLFKEPIVGIFIGEIANTEVTNSYCMDFKTEFAKNAIASVVDENNSKSIDLSEVIELNAMYQLADSLNKDSNAIWVNQNNAFPQLNFVTKI